MRMDRERQLVLAFMMTALCALFPIGRAHAQTDAGPGAVAIDVSAYPQVALTIDVPDGPGASWTATVNESGVSRPAVVQAGAQGAIEVVLAIDTSGSMAGAPLAAAKSSALAFVQQLCALFGWFASLVLGRMPEGLRDAGAHALRYSGQLAAYVFVLTDHYPHGSPLAGEPPSEPSPSPESDAGPSLDWGEPGAFV